MDSDVNKTKIIKAVDEDAIKPYGDEYDFTKMKGVSSVSSTKVEGAAIDKEKDISGEEDNGRDIIAFIIQTMINTLPDYVNGKDEDYYKNEYIKKNAHVIQFDEGEGKELKGGKTQKRKKMVKSKRRQRTIKNNV